MEEVQKNVRAGYIDWVRENRLEDEIKVPTANKFSQLLGKSGTKKGTKKVGPLAYVLIDLAALRIPEPPVCR